MFFFLAFFAAGFILTAFFGPKMKIENAKAATMDDFSFPRADEGDPVGRYYGTIKHTAPNTIAIKGFKAVPIKKKVKTGLFSSKKVITGYEYYMTVDLAWALGPGVVYRKMWFGQNLVWTGCLYGEGCLNVIPLNLPELYGGSKDGARGGIRGDVAMYCGDFDQDRDSYLVSNLDPEVPAYVGIAHMVFRDFWWGNSPQIDAVAVELAYFTNSLGLDGSKHIMENGLDANPVEVIYDVMTYGWGNLGYDPAKINVDGWQEAAEVIWNEANGISIGIANATEAKDAVKTMLRQINATMYEDMTTGLVELKLIRNDYDIEDLPVFGPDKVVEVRNFTKKLWSETINVVRVSYTDREAGYTENKPALAKDFSLLRFQGKERPVEIKMPGVKVAALANEIAARELSNLNIPLHSCQLITDRQGNTLKPGDPFVWQWPEYNIAQMIMRVKKASNGTLENGAMSFDVVQDEYGSAATVISAPAPSEYVPETFVPVDITDFKLFELPHWLDYQAGLGTLAGRTRLASFAIAPTSYTLGYDAFIDDTPDDAQVLTLAPYTNSATLVSAIDRFDGWATGTLASIDITTPSQPADAELAADPRLGGGLMLIGDELLAYTSAVDNLDDTWTLSTVKRALLDTTWLAHASGAIVYLFEGQEGFFESDTLNGETTDVYLIDRTATGSSAEADAVVTEFTNVGRVELPLPPDYVTLEGSRTALQQFAVGSTATIDARARNRNDVIEIAFEDDAAGTAEAGTTYRISFEVGGVVTEIADDETLPYDIAVTSAMTGECVFLVEAKRDGLYSFTAAPIPVIIGALRLTEASDVRYTEDGEVRLMLG